MADRVFFDVEPAIGALLGALDEELERGAIEGAHAVAEDAATTHTYQNRTGRLQNRTRAGRAIGRASSGALRVDVLGDTRYGSYVEEGTSRSRPYPYLAPAWVRTQGEFARIVEQAIERATWRAWGGA